MTQRGTQSLGAQGLGLQVSRWWLITRLPWLIFGNNAGTMSWSKEAEVAPTRAGKLHTHRFCLHCKHPANRW